MRATSQTALVSTRRSRTRSRCSARRTQHRRPSMWPSSATTFRRGWRLVYDSRATCGSAIEESSLLVAHVASGQRRHPLVRCSRSASRDSGAPNPLPRRHGSRPCGHAPGADRYATRRRQLHARGVSGDRRTQLGDGERLRDDRRSAPTDRRRGPLDEPIDTINYTYAEDHEAARKMLAERAASLLAQPGVAFSRSVEGQPLRCRGSGRMTRSTPTSICPFSSWAASGTNITRHRRSPSAWRSFAPTRPIFRSWSETFDIVVVSATLHHFLSRRCSCASAAW